MGFEDIVFFNLDINGTCVVDADIAGIGVVTSFFAAALMTTLASIYAAILDGVIGEATVLPDFINRMLQRKTGSVEKYKFHREVLVKVMISLADQQLMTGYALLICGFLRAARSNIPTWDPHADGSYHSKLRDAHFDLIVFLSCLSASSHLACVLVLKGYLRENKVIMTIRTTLIVIFTILLAVTIGLSPPLSFGYHITYGTYNLKLTKTISLSVLIMYLAVASFLIALFVEEIHEKWNSILHLVGSRLGPKHKPKIIRKLSAWGFSVLPTVQFFSQLVYFTFALILAASQKFAQPPIQPDGPQKLCGLSSAAANVWGFGQTLPIFFLFAPVFTGISEYYEIKNEKYKCEVKEKELSSATNMLSPPRASSLVSAADSLPSYRISLDPNLDRSLAGDWHRRRLSRNYSSSPSSTRPSVDMAAHQGFESAPVSRRQSAEGTREEERHPTRAQHVVSAASFRGQNPTQLDYLWLPQADRM